MNLTIWNYLKKYKLQLSFIALFSILSTASSIIVPYLNGMFIDELITSNSISYIVGFAAKIIVIGLLGAVASYFVSMSTAKMTANVSFDMLSDSIRHVQKIPYDIFTARFSPAYLIQRMTGDLNTVFSFFLNNYMNVFLRGLSFIIVIAVMATINIQVFLISILFIPLYLVCYIVLRKPLLERNRECKERGNHYSKTMFEQIDRLYEIKVEAAFDRSATEGRRSFSEYLTSLISLNRVSYLFTSLDGIIAVLFQSVVLIIGGIQIIEGEMTIGEFTILNTYFAILLSCIKYYFNLGKSLQDYKSSKDRMDEILGINEETNGETVKNKIESIRVCNVTYSYPSQDSNVVNNLDMTFEKGDIVLMRGPNGAGKTTSINIILGILQNLTEGRVEYDGMDIREIDMYSTRRDCISALIQSPVCPDSTVAGYLGDFFGLDFKGTMALIKMIGLEKLYTEGDFDLSDYWNSKIGNLSGGQRQRIMLLKALGKRNDILILDEPTTGLDREGTDILMRYLYESKSSRITIIVSHDPKVESISSVIIDMRLDSNIVCDCI